MTTTATKPAPTYLVIGPGVWGRGETEEQAVNAARKAGHYGRRKLKRYLVYEIDDPEVRVDQDGFIVHKGKPPRLVKRVGMEE
jgi:hypothetical protein